MMDSNDSAGDWIDRELVARAISGDGLALDQVLRAARPGLVRWLTAKIAPEFQSLVAPDDVIQQAQAEVVRRIGTFELRGPGSFERWIATIAVRRLRTTIRDARTAKRGGDHRRVGAVRNPEDSAIDLLNLLSGSGSTPSRVYSKREALDMLRESISALPDHYRQAVWGVYIEGKQVREVGERLGRTERAVHGLCRRGLEKLREQLGTPSMFLTGSGPRRRRQM